VSLERGTRWNIHNIYAVRGGLQVWIASLDSVVTLSKCSVGQVESLCCAIALKASAFIILHCLRRTHAPVLMYRSGVAVC
jgi:hypothetical protein